MHGARTQRAKPGVQPGRGRQALGCAQQRRGVVGGDAQRRLKLRHALWVAGKRHVDDTRLNASVG